jgi:hypothetical protein
METGISEGNDLQKIPQETQEEMGGENINFNTPEK